MKGKVILAFAALLFLIANAVGAKAEVKRVQMRIDGYLCGN